MNRWIGFAAAAAVIAVMSSPVTATVMLAGLTFPMCGLLAWMMTMARRDPPWIIPALPTLVEAGAWEPSPGTVLVGVTHQHATTECHDGYAFACWRLRTTPHMLVCGPSGSGKTTVMRWFIAALILAGYDVAIIDGKGGGSVGADFAPLDRVLMVAEEPGQWMEATYHVRDEMRERYQRLRRWRYGEEARPQIRPVALVIDELEDVCAVAGDRFTDALFEITRMGREAGGRVLASILRPDTTTIPGKVRDSLSGRVFMGTPNQTAALMMFDDSAAAARDASAGAADVDGRGVALLAGRVYPIQIPLVADGRAAVAALVGKEPEP